MMLHFPVGFRLGPLVIPAHFVFETLAYAIAFRVYLSLKSRRGDTVNSEQRLMVIAAAAVGAALGSKILNWFADPLQTLHNWHNIYYLMQGKTIIGGLIGGLFAVEAVKKAQGITRRTGDLFAIPLAVGIAVGRIGCFLAGLDDGTYGTQTSLPWAVNFGDGVRRHPTQIYEIIALVLFTFVLFRLSGTVHREGDLFKAFMVGYFSLRIFLDYLKPGVFLLGLTGLQWACVAMLIYYARDIPYLFGFGKALAYD